MEGEGVCKVESLKSGTIEIDYDSCTRKSLKFITVIKAEIFIYFLGSHEH